MNNKLNSKIGLALSGGGALGVAHVGVLEQLEKNNIRIDQISGTSAGAIIAAVYASGGLDWAEQLSDEVTKIEFFKQKKPYKIISPSAYYEMIFELVAKYTAASFEQTKIPVSIVATNLRTGKLTTFTQGNLLEAVKASCAYPGVFPLQKIAGESYIDGGITCNLPSPVIRDKVDFLIGSDLNNLPTWREETITKLNRIKILMRSIEIIQGQLSDLYSQECNYCYKMDFKNLKWYSFNKIEFIREKGKNEAAAQTPSLIQALQN